MEKKIGIIGTGNMGQALGRLLADHSYEIFLGSRDPDKGRQVAEELCANIQGGSIIEAAEFGGIVILAVHYNVVSEALAAAGPLAGKTVIDITNPLTPDFSGLVVGHTSSAAEEIAALIPDAKVVKAFNYAFAATFQNEIAFSPEKPTMFYCGDDTDAKAEVDMIISDIGFDPIDAGPLQNARYLEPLAMLIIQLGFAQKMGTSIAFKLLRR